MDLEKILEAAREMRALYCAEQTGLQQPLVLNTTKFGRVIGEHTGYEIIDVITSEFGEHLRGMLLRPKPKEKNQALILIADNNNECWKRFIYVKEVCHLYLDTSESFTDNSEMLASILLSDEDPDPELKPIYESEKAALRAALEIMIPEYLRDRISHDARVEKKTPFQIAFQLKVPRKYVEFRMRQWGISVKSDD